MFKTSKRDNELQITPPQPGITRQLRCFGQETLTRRKKVTRAALCAYLPAPRFQDTPSLRLGINILGKVKWFVNLRIMNIYRIIITIYRFSGVFSGISTIFQDIP